MLGKPDAGRIIVVVLFGIGAEDMPKVPALIIGIEVVLFHKWSNTICPGEVLAVAKVDVFNGNLIGPGGFLEIAQNARKVVFCGTFDAKGSKIDVTPDGLHIAQSGQIPKLVTQVEKITFSAAYAQQSGQEVLYITERAVFQLTAEGVELIEIASGVEIERDILPYMAFRPIIKHPRLMESSLFTPMEDA